MILIPEQIYNIREEIRRNKETISGYIDYLKNFKEEQVIGEFSRLPSNDQSVSDAFGYEMSKKDENYNALISSFYLQKRNLEVIDIGTRFIMCTEIDGEEEIEDCMLVDELIGVSSQEGYISKNCVAGIAIKGKRENDEFSYIVNNIEINGKILKVEKNPEKYMHFIRDIECAKEIYDNENLQITQSQKELLKYEKEFLEKFNKKTAQVQERINTINKFLNRPTVILPDDDRIGVGSAFSILFFGNDETKSIRVEMIDKAVSTELTSEYIEKSSSLGLKLFGLKNNEEFIISDNNSNTISGIVFDIDNRSNRFETNNYLTYQKSRVK